MNDKCDSCVDGLGWVWNITTQDAERCPLCNSKPVDYELPCPDCIDGKVLVEVSGGRFDSHEQQWFPDEREVQCKTCHGTSTVLASDMRWLDSNGLLDFRNAADNYPWPLSRHEIQRVYDTHYQPSTTEQVLPF